MDLAKLGNEWTYNEIVGHKLLVQCVARRQYVALERGPFFLEHQPLTAQAVLVGMESVARLPQPTTQAVAVGGLPSSSSSVADPATPIQRGQAVPGAVGAPGPAGRRRRAAPSSSPPEEEM